MMSLSGFSIRIIRALWNELGTVSSSRIFWNSLQRIDVNSPLNVWWRAGGKAQVAECLPRKVERARPFILQYNQYCKKKKKKHVWWNPPVKPFGFKLYNLLFDLFQVFVQICAQQGSS
jgi:hypothetical protein